MSETEHTPQMITKLTPEQEAHLPEIRDEWIRRGLRTEPIDRGMAIKDFTLFQSQIIKRAPAPVVVLDGPLDAWLAVCIFSGSQVLSQVLSQVRSQVRSQVDSQVDSQVLSQARSQVEWQVQWQVDSQVESQVLSQVDSQVLSQIKSQVLSQVESKVEWQVDSQVLSKVRSQVDSQVLSQVDSQVLSQVDSQVLSQVRSQVLSQLGSQLASDAIWPYWDGQFWASYFSFYETMRFLGVKLCRKYQILKACAVGICWPLPDICIVADSPSAIHMRNSLLHKDGGAAIEYRDGLKCYALNGVRMLADHVLTPAEKLDPQIVLNEKNAEVRRELLRKIGMERFLRVCPHRSLDKKGSYELLSIPLSEEIKDSRWLKMLNPSIGVWHVEAVAQECTTVQQAINSRPHYPGSKTSSLSSQQTEDWKPDILT